VVLPGPDSGKGEMLCQVSNFWFDKTAHIVPNHLTHESVAAVLPAGVDAALYEKRSVVVKKLKPVPVEAIARGYLIGSGWKDYQRSGELCGIRLPAACARPSSCRSRSSRLDQGGGRRPRRERQLRRSRIARRRRTGRPRARCHAGDLPLRRRLRARARHHHRRHQVRVRPRRCGRAARDGRNAHPDSSRFWPADSYQVGISPPSYDKQFVRDYLETLDWNKTAPGPKVPAEVIARTAANTPRRCSAWPASRSTEAAVN
jgi:phosphoribosylaminoimidazole-succinocarboxamide synthase